MSRRKASKRRDIEPDPKYNDVTLARFINYVMRKGKKSVAENLVYDAFDIIEKKSGQKGLEVFHKAIDNVRPVLEVSSRRVGGATYQIPIEVRPDRRMALAMRWITGYARSRSEKTMAERLANELMSAARNEGPSVEEAGRHSQDGRGEPGVRSLQVVASPAGSSTRRCRSFDRRLRSANIGFFGVLRLIRQDIRVFLIWCAEHRTFLTPRSPAVIL